MRIVCDIEQHLKCHRPSPVDSSKTNPIRSEEMGFRSPKSRQEAELARGGLDSEALFRRSRMLTDGRVERRFIVSV